MPPAPFYNPMVFPIVKAKRDFEPECAFSDRHHSPKAASKSPKRSPARSAKRSPERELNEPYQRMPEYVPFDNLMCCNCNCPKQPTCCGCPLKKPNKPKKEKGTLSRLSDFRHEKTEEKLP